jgi:integrase
MLRKAHKWGYLPNLPEFEFLKEFKKLPTYITPEEFAKLYQACDVAKYPDGLPYPAAAWWRGLLVFAYLTGWRIGAILALKRENVDLEAGTALSLAGENKGRRDQLVPLHPLIVEHLKQLPAFDPCFFPWNHPRRALFDQFAQIQEGACVKPAGTRKRFGFHDLRRAFATMNADRLTPDALQFLMQHKDYQTTQRYINLARQMNSAVAKLFVPQLHPDKVVKAD